VLEETGLEVSPLRPAAIFERIMPDIEGQTEFHYVIVDYICELTGGTLRAASDVSDAQWVPLEHLERVKLAPGTAPVIERAMRMARGAAA
jgi:ADP-ribose pyrophosphatase YjhB (NUDIX family)